MKYSDSEFYGYANGKLLWFKAKHILVEEGINRDNSFRVVYTLVGEGINRDNLFHVVMEIYQLQKVTGGCVVE